jgi:hypothetical protein
MKIGIIGPSKLDSLLDINKNSKEIVEKVAKILKLHEIYLTPDKGSVSEYFAQEYIKHSVNKVNLIIPLQDKEFGYSWVNKDIGNIFDCGTWRNQPENLNENTEVLVCLGYSAGGLAEIAYSKWFKPEKDKKKPVYIIKELISSKLPKELEKSLGLKYISCDKLKI